MEPKPNYKTKHAGNGRLRFDAIDMLRQARGLPTPEGHVVLTKDFVQFIEAELARLYAVEDVATEYAADVEKMHPHPYTTMNDVLDALGLPIPAQLKLDANGEYPAISTGKNGRQVIDI